MLATLLYDMAMAEAREDQSQSAAVRALAGSLQAKTSGATDLTDRFGDLLQASITATQSKDRILAFLHDIAALVTTAPSKDPLRAMVAAYVPPANQPEILALLDLMTEAEVAAFFSDVTGQVRGTYAPLVTALDTFIVACQESLPFNSKEGFEAFNAGLTFPFLTLDTAAQAQMYKICDLIPPVAARAGQHDPVTSDIPALVLYGLNDTQTSSADARDTAARLGNARALGFPEAGHGALIFSQCAKDIGLAFIERPADDLATGCIDSLKPRWVLPPG
jgi:pimeloyl-ACP methyl ester carboxylesterase